MTDAERIAALEAAVAELCDRAGVLWTPPATPAEGREAHAKHCSARSSPLYECSCGLVPPPATAGECATCAGSGSVFTTAEAAECPDCGGRGRR